MRRLRAPLCLALLASVLVTAPAETAAPSLAKGRLLDCVTSVEPGGRRATFEGDMVRVPRASRMQIKFVLQVQKGERWRRVSAPGLGVWSTSKPGVARYVYTKTVEELIAPGVYRALIGFRWIDAAGRTVRKSSRVSRVCRQPDPRPQLRPTSLRIEPGSQPGKWRYVAELRNAGLADAGPFWVELEAGGERRRLGHLDALAGGGRTVVSGETDQCIGWVILWVDAQGEVEERDEKDNALRIPCDDPAA